MIEDYIKFALNSITHRRVRSWLTMLGIFVGIIAVVALISLSEGLQQVIQEQAQAVGSDRIAVSPGGGGMMTGGSTYTSAKLGESDLDVIKKVRGVDSAIGAVVATGKIRYKDKTKFISVFGVDTDSKTQNFLEEIDYFSVEEGRYLRENDVYKAQVGPSTGPDMFDREIDIGGKIRIEDKEFDVVGINKETGNPMHDLKITIPLETAEELFDKKDDYSSISVKVEKGYDPSEVADSIEEKLRKHRNVDEDEEDFSVETFENLIGAFTSVLDIVQVVLIGIAAISLLVGGIGIMTTMYTSVIERIHQIGIMKAIGARNSSIMAIFLIEGGFLGMVGGIIGTLGGLGVSFGVEYALKNFYNFDMFHAYMGPELIVFSLTFSFLWGCIWGGLPARKAAKMHPVDALRHR